MEKLNECLKEARATFNEEGKVIEVSLTKTDIFREKTLGKIGCFLDATVYGFSIPKIELYMKGDLVTIDHRGDDIVSIDLKTIQSLKKFIFLYFPTLKTF